MAMNQATLEQYLNHLAHCEHCQQNVFKLCKVGMRLLVRTSPAILDHTQKNGATW